MRSIAKSSSFVASFFSVDICPLPLAEQGSDHYLAQRCNETLDQSPIRSFTEAANLIEAECR
jgi:hypothetical protein